MYKTYSVEDMRVVVTTGKVKENNPDRVLTIHGKFFDEKGERLSFASKEITTSIANDAGTVIDVENGILTLPAGERGRKPSASVSQSDVDDILNSLRNSAAK